MAEQTTPAPTTTPPPPSPPAGQSAPPAQRPDAAQPRELSNTEYHHLSVDQRRAYDDRRVAARDARDAPRRDGGQQVDAGDDRSGDQQPPAEQTTPATVKIGELNLTEQDIRGLMERAGIEASRKATLPADPSGYKLELPKDFVAPQGVEFKWATNDPALAPLIDQARTFAHQAGFDQEQFSKMMSFYAAEISKVAKFNEVLQREIQKLGPSGTPRITAIQQFLRGHLGDDLARPMSAMIVSEPIVRAFESLMRRMSGQSSHNFTHASREAPEPEGRVTEEQWNAMGPGQKLDYARQFPQDQFNGGGRR